MCFSAHVMHAQQDALCFCACRIQVSTAWPNLQACELSRIALQTRAWRIVSQLCETWVFIVALCEFQTNTHTTCHQHSAQHSASSVQLNSRSEKIFGKSIVFLKLWQIQVDFEFIWLWNQSQHSWITTNPSNAHQHLHQHSLSASIENTHSVFGFLVQSHEHSPVVLWSRSQRRSRLFGHPVLLYTTVQNSTYNTHNASQQQQ